MPLAMPIRITPAKAAGRAPDNSTSPPTGTNPNVKRPSNSVPPPTTISPPQPVSPYERGQSIYPPNPEIPPPSPYGLTSELIAAIKAQNTADPEVNAAYQANLKLQEYVKALADQGRNLTQAEIADLQNQLLKADALAKRGRVELYQDRNTALQKHGIDLEKLGLDREGLAAAVQQAIQNAGLSLQGIGNERTYAGSRYDSILQQLGLVDKYANRTYQNQVEGLGLQRDQNTRLQTSDASNRGAVFSSGHSDALGEIIKQFNIGEQSADITRDKALEDSGLARKDAKLGLDKTYQDLNLSEAEIKTKLQQTKDNAATQTKAYDLMTKQFGISRTEIERALERGLKNLGLETANAKAAIEKAIGTAQGQIPAQVLNLIQEIMKLSNGSGVKAW